MYIPPHFRVEDPAKLTAFMQQHSFATLVTVDEDAPFASHLPFLLRPGEGDHGTLFSHMARANPQWVHFTPDTEVMVIFDGPHSYISPSWYQSDVAVPTWNYAVVHAYGIPRVISGYERVVEMLRDTVATFEGPRENPWPGELPEAFRDRLVQEIVAFEIPITRVEGKFKLGQNRSIWDVRSVYNALSRSEDPENRALAELMRKECDVSGDGEVN